MPLVDPSASLPLSPLPALIHSRSLPTDVGFLITESFLDQALPVWDPKLSHNEVEPDGTGKEQDWELRDQLQKKTSQLQTKEKEVRGLFPSTGNAAGRQPESRKFKA